MKKSKLSYLANIIYCNQIFKITILVLLLINTIFSQDSVVKKVFHDWENNFTYVDDNGWSYPDRFNYQTNDNTGDPVLDCSYGRLFGVFHSVSKTFTGLPKHYKIDVTLGFSFIMSWDSNEKLTIEIDSNQVYERFTDIAHGDYLELDLCSIPTMDFSKYVLPRRHSFTLDHTSSSVSISFMSNLDELLVNESFGIQDIIISVQTCYFTCSECTGPLSTDCSSCPSNSTQNGNECQCNENFVAFENECIGSCPAGYTENTNRICVQDCNIENCQSCSDQECTSCNANYKLLNGQCYESCPWFTTDEGTYCKDQFYIDITTQKSYTVMDFMENEFNNLKIKNQGYQLNFFEEQNSLNISSFFNYSYQCLSKQLIMGFFQYSHQNCKTSDCFIKKNYTGLKKHYRVLLRVLVIYGDSMDSDDTVKYYLDNNEIYNAVKIDGTSNLCGIHWNERIENIQIEIAHTSTSLEFKVDPNFDAFGFDEWYGFRELSIVLYECINQFCTSCSDGNTCASCEGTPGLPTTRTGNTCDCQLGHYSTGEIQCIQCITLKCETCSDTIKCDTCNGLQRSGQQCECPTELFWDNFPTDQDCQSCVNNRCLTCSNGSDCDTCKYSLINNRISSSQCSCPDEYFDKTDEVDCQKCTGDCFTCVTTSTNCILSCDHKCNGCEGSVSTCLSCRGDRINSNCICDVHKYDDGTSEICQDCDVSCDTCNLTDKCTICKGNRVPIGGDSHQCECSGSDIDHLPLTYYCTSCEVGILQKVELQQDYLQILLQFYVDIEIFNFKENTTLFSNNLCSHILKIETLQKLGGNVECKIESTDSILIQFKESPIIKIGDLIEIAPKSINQVGCTTSFQEFYINELTLNPNPFPPTIELLGPTSSVSLCETVLILATEISNDGYRGLTDIIWTLNETNDGNISEIEQILTNHYNKNFVEFKPLQLNEDKTYKIKAEFKNLYNKIGIQTFTIVSKFKSGIQAQISQTEPLIFKNFKQISLEGSMKYLECEGEGIVQEKNKQMNVKWIQDDNGVETVLSEYISNDQDKLSEITISPYSHVAGTTYQIHFEVSLLENNLILGSNSSKYKIEIVPLLVYIEGGSRMNAYASELNMTGVAKNPNVDLNEQEIGIIYEWTCDNLNNSIPCEQIDGTLITFTPNSKEQNFPKKIFEPYNALLFQFKGTKNSEFQINSSVIIIVETDLPLLLVSVPESFLSEKLNKNDDLQINILNDYSSTDQLFFSLIFIYDFEVVATKSFEYTSFSFRIWDLFDNFKPSINQLLVKVSMYNPQYFMPSQTSYNILTNSPPSNGSIVVTPLQGNSLQTEFQIELINYADNDSPLSYKYQFYTSLQSYENEKLAGQNPTSSQKNILSDFTIQNQFTTILPQGNLNENNNQYELLIMVTVSDSLGGITNVTQTIQCDPDISLSEDQKIQNLQSLFDQSQNKNIEDQIKDLNILSIEMFQQEQQNNQLTSNDEYQGVKLQVYEKLNEYVNQISTKVIQDQAVKSINQLIKDPNLIQNKSSSNIENSINEMETILNNKQTELENIKQSGLINTGDNKISRRNQAANLILGNQIKVMDQMTNSFNIIKNRRRRYLSQEEVQQNQDKVFKLTKKINKALQSTSLPNEDAISFEGDSFKQVVQKNTPSKIQERFFKNQQTLNGYSETQVSNQFYNSENIDPEQEYIYETSSQTFKENILKDQKGFPYPSQNEQMYDIDISNTNNPDQQISINQSITTNFGQLGDEEQNKVCISQSVETDEWDAKACKNVEEEDENGQIILSCECKSITPTTVVADLDNIFAQSTIGQAFGDEGLKALANFEFWKSIIFYVFVFKTSLLIFLVYNGYKKDKIDIQELELKKQKLENEKIEQKIDDQNLEEQNHNIDIDLHSSEKDLQSHKDFNTNTNIESVKQRKFKKKRRSNKKIYPEGQTQDQDGFTNSNCDTPNALNRNSQLDDESNFNYANKSKKFRKKTSNFKIANLENSKQSDNSQEINNNKNGNNQENDNLSQKQNQDQNLDQNQNQIQILNIETVGDQLEENKLQDNDQPGTKDEKSVKLHINLNNHSIKSKDQDQHSIPQTLTNRNNNDTSSLNFQVNRKNSDLQNEQKKQQNQIIIQQEQSGELNQSDEAKNSEENKSAKGEDKKPEKQEPVYIKHKEIVNFVLRIHELLGIHYLYDDKLSRPVRYMCFYLKLCIILAFSSSIINEESTQYESILISTATSILSGIPLAILKSLLSKQNVVKYIGFIIYIFVSLASVYLMITNAALMGVDTSNNWTLAYLSSFFIDVFFYQVMQGFAKLAIFNWSIGKQGCKLLIRKILALDKGLSKYFQRNVVDDLDMSV